MPYLVARQYPPYTISENELEELRTLNMVPTATYDKTREVECMRDNCDSKLKYGYHHHIANARKHFVRCQERQPQHQQQIIQNIINFQQTTQHINFL